MWNWIFEQNLGSLAIYMSQSWEIAYHKIWTKFSIQFSILWRSTEFKLNFLEDREINCCKWFFRCSGLVRCKWFSCKWPISLQMVATSGLFCCKWSLQVSSFRCKCPILLQMTYCKWPAVSSTAASGKIVSAICLAANGFAANCLN